MIVSLSFLHRLIRGILLFLIFFLPLFFGHFFDLFGLPGDWFHTNLIFTLPKEVLFVIIVDITAILFIISCWLYPSQKMILPGRSLAILLLSYIGIAVIATLVSDVPFISFVGSYEKGQGLAMLLHYVLFFGLLLNLFTKTDRQRLFGTVTISALLVSLYAVLQGLGFDPLNTVWNSSTLNGRVFSTLGHPNYLALWLVITLPLSCAYFFQVFVAKKVFGTLVASLSVLFQVLALLLSLSRAAVIALLLAVVLVAAIYLWFHARKRWVMIALALGALLTITVFWSGGGEALRFNEANSSSINSRLILWQDTWRMISERPWLGYGLDTYSVFFPRFKSRELLYLEDWSQNADRAHNFILDTAQSIGIVGLVAFLSLLIYLSFLGIRGLKDRQSNSGAAFILLVTFWAYLGANLFGFSLPVHDMYFWLLVGFFVLLNDTWKQKSVWRSARYLSIPLIVLLLTSLWFYSNVLIADQAFFRAIARNEKEQLAVAVEHNPYFPVYLLSAGKTAGSYPQSILDQLAFMTRGKDYRSFLLEAVWSERNGKAEETRSIFEQLTRDFPNVPAIWIEWAAFEKRQNNFILCADVLDRLIEIVDLPYVSSFRQVYRERDACKIEYRS